VSGRLGAERAEAITPRLVAGWCGLTAQRLRDALDLQPTAEGIATMLSLHPMFAPRTYIATTVTHDGESVRLAFGDCPAALEGDALTWFTGLGASSDTALAAVVAAYHPQARLTAVPSQDGELLAYQIVIDPSADPTPECDELAIAKISTGARFKFRPPFPATP
jgi:hypothetical protein